MAHYFDNTQLISHQQKVQNGDTFKCRCRKSDSYNSWKFQNDTWFFLTIQTENWVESRIVPIFRKLKKLDLVNPTRRDSNQIF